MEEVQKTRFERFREFMRSFMKLKLVFDIMTFSIIGLLLGSYWAPTHMHVDEYLVNFWFYLLMIFVSSREAGRWIGEYKSGAYQYHWVAHGEIYLTIFLALPFLIGVPQAFLRSSVTLDQKEIADLIRDLGVKVAIVYVASALSKKASQRHKHLVEKASEFVRTMAEGKKK